MNKLLNEIEIIPSTSGEGYSVIINGRSWWFANSYYASMFANKVAADEIFYEEQMNHYHSHEWNRCKPQTCKGKLWQLIQGMK